MPKRIDETQPKQCADCGQIKVPHEFTNGPRRKDGTRGLSSYCKKCGVIRNIRYRALYPDVARKANKTYYHGRDAKRRKTDILYQIQRRLYRGRADAKKGKFTPCIATAKEILEAFTGKCYVCGVPEVECLHKLHIDHNHITGKFRGFLCNTCNQAAGMMKDSPELLMQLAMYVEQDGLVYHG